MDPSISRRRRIGVGGAVVAASSVLRMQSEEDEVVSSNKAIVKKTIHLHADDEEDKNSNKQMMSLKEATLVGVNGKRLAWKTDTKRIPSNETNRGDSLKLTRPRSIGATPPVTTPRRSIGSTPPMTPRRSISSDLNDKSSTVSVKEKKVRSDSTPGRVKKTRSELCTAIVKPGEFDSVPLRKVSSLPDHSSDESNEKTEDVNVRTEDVHVETEDLHIETEKTVDEKTQITEEVKHFKEIVVSEDEHIDSGDHEEDEEEEDDDEEDEEDEEEVEKQSIDVKEMNFTKQSSDNNRVESQFHNRTGPSPPSPVRTIPPPVIKRAASVHSVPPNASAEKEENFTHPQSKLQSLEDLVMWRDASRSTLVFGFGTFLIISSSYANDLNFSFISVVAYMGLIYLGVMFVFKAVIRRGIVEEERHEGVGVREKDVQRILRLIMPYLNESLLQLRALFSGDPSTTLKMGVVLFMLARCGSSITLWNLAKFGFLGAFTVPKVFISYSTHFSAYGEFWLRRFRDAWETCNHKKAVALALFTLVWNLLSVVARVWAAFMLFVAFRYYQQNMVWTTDQDNDDDDEYVVDDDQEEEEEEEEQAAKLKRDSYMMMMPNKLKKIS